MARTIYPREFLRTPPRQGQFTLVGSGTVTDTGDGILFKDAGHAGTNITYMYKSWQTALTPRRVGIRLLSNTPTYTGIGVYQTGVIVGDSASGKLTIFGTRNSASGGTHGLGYSDYTNVTTHSASPLYVHSFPHTPRFLSIKDDGVNMSIETSLDGNTWTMLSNRVRDAFLPNGGNICGFFAHAPSVTGSMGAEAFIDHFTEAV